MRQQKLLSLVKNQYSILNSDFGIYLKEFGNYLSLLLKKNSNIGCLYRKKILILYRTEWNLPHRQQSFRWDPFFCTLYCADISPNTHIITIFFVSITLSIWLSLSSAHFLYNWYNQRILKKNSVFIDSNIKEMKSCCCSCQCTDECPCKCPCDCSKCIRVDKS